LTRCDAPAAGFTRRDGTDAVIRAISFHPASISSMVAAPSANIDNAL